MRIDRVGHRSVAQAAARGARAARAVLSCGVMTFGQAYDADLEALNAAAVPEMRESEESPGLLTHWLGECCSYCGTMGYLTFVDARYVDDPLTPCEGPVFRAATPEELEPRGLVLAEGERAYCVESKYDQGEDRPRMIVVALGVIVDWTPA